MGFGQQKRITSALVAVLTFAFAFLVSAQSTYASETAAGKAAGFGVIKGVVRDHRGKPISKATVAVFKLGTSKLLKQVTASKSGKFFAKIVPGTYTVLAVAQGFNPVTLNEVKVGREDELVYGFKLERAGSGNTIPEKRADKKSAKWAIRAARRSIYQIDENGGEVLAAESEVENESEPNRIDSPARPGSSVVETFAGVTGNGMVSGVNFATLRPVGETSELLIAGQVSDNHANRFETAFSFNANKDHRVRLRGSVSQMGDIVKTNEKQSKLAQVSVRATDQWSIREGVVLVLGLDYSRFVGAGNASALTPRVGVQYDLDSRTRVRSAFTTRTEERTWGKVIALESSQVLFAEPASVQDIAVEGEKPLMNRSSRFELGVERILDSRSSIEINAFFDTVADRGVGIGKMPLQASDSYSSFVGLQNGNATGIRVVASRRFGGIFSAATGYSFGTGQTLSREAVLNPATLFENGLFQTIFGKVEADFDSGTSVTTIFRFSSDATVFAIDPFEGRLAIYDPGLSVLVTQHLPTLGLPIDAEATFDARNLFGTNSAVGGADSSLFLNSQQRMVRGSILVRF